MMTTAAEIITQKEILYKHSEASKDAEHGHGLPNVNKELHGAATEQKNRSHGGPALWIYPPHSFEPAALALGFRPLKLN